MHTIYRYRWAAALLLTAFCLPISAWSEEIPYSSPESTASSSPVKGSVEASLNHDEAAGTWSLHMTGSFTGEGARITDISLFGTDASGTPVGMSSITADQNNPLPVSSPFSWTAEIPKPNPDWSEVGVDLTISSGQQAIHSKSALFPIIWREPVLMNHAVSGTLLPASNYVYGGIPEGIGIPYATIDHLPTGDYYAVVFFEGASGCPSSNYEINAFRPSLVWGEDIRGPNAPFAKAYSSRGGGCMQEFHINPNKGEGWLWGALSNTGTSSAVADADGIPAFAICATAAACDPIAPHAATTLPASPEDSHLISNVLFLPGIKGSKLYEDNPLCILSSDSCGIPLWLPILDTAVPELFLDAGGKSKRAVFVKEGELLGNAYGHHFYDSFTHVLDAAKAAGTFGSGWNWRTIAYDWRLSLPDIIQGGTEDGERISYTGPFPLPYIEQQLRELGSTSPTGKVTVIAHSNGGLVAKALMAALGDTVSAQLIDTVILVGVPQSGAPRALGALLYGDEEGIPGIHNMPNVIMSTAHAREFGLNSPMSYHLLPSAAYLGLKLPYPLVTFGEGDLLSREHAAYGSSIDTEDELHSFALAQDGDRQQPEQGDLTSANVLNPALLTYAAQEHEKLDTWQPPTGVEIYELGGYGVPTISGIDLYQSSHKDKPPTVSYRPLFMQDGDGTVPIASSFLLNASLHTHQVWLDLSNMRYSKVSYSHGNMLEAPDVQESIQAILNRSRGFPATAHAMDVPVIATATKQIALYVHSPVSLTVTDAHGTESSVSTDGSKEDIPGSAAGTLGEVKYVLVHADSGPYDVRLIGESLRTFTLDIQELEGNKVIASSTIADVPVVANTRASLLIGTSLQDVSALSVDENADDSIDFSITPQLGATVFYDAPISIPESKTKALVRTKRPISKVILTKIAGIASSTTAIPSLKVKALLEHVRKNSHSEAVVQGISTAMHTIVDATVPKHVSLISRIRSFIRRALNAVLNLFRMLSVQQVA